MTTDRILSLIALVGVLVITGFLVAPRFTQVGQFGAAGNLLAENYEPYIMYNGGFNTAKPMNIGAAFTSTVSAIFSGTFQVGASGTSQANQVKTTCSPKADNSITASTTGYAYCTGVTGVTSVDNVIAMLATSTLGSTVGADGFYITEAKASTTAGAVDLGIFNASGKNAAPSAVGRAASTTVIDAGH